MNVKFIVNEYTLVWYLLFQQSISVKLNNYKQKLWNNFQNEYIHLEKEKQLILKDPKNYIPDNDTIYDLIKDFDDYNDVLKETDKYKVNVLKVWDSYKSKVNKELTNILRFEIKDYNILLVNPKLNVIDLSAKGDGKTNTIVYGKKMKTNPVEAMMELVYIILRKELKGFNEENREIVEAIVELAILNELGTRITGKSCYLIGRSEYQLLKRQIYPYFLMYLGVDRDTWNSNYLLKQYVATMLALNRKNLDLEDMGNVYYWMRTLGAYISQTKPFEQGSALLTTFITCLDARTIINVNRIVGGSKKDTPWTILRWMFIDFASLSNKNTSLRNKRLRYTEYLIAPLVREVQMKLYRYLKTRPKMRDMKRLLDILKISSSCICHSIIGKTKSKNTALNITKYSSQVNDFSIINSAIERTTAKRASAQMRAMDASCLGNLDMISFSSLNCGIAGVICPWAEVDKDTMTFKSV